MRGHGEFQVPVVEVEMLGWSHCTGGLKLGDLLGC